MPSGKIKVSKAAARHLGRGHPWIWERGIDVLRGEPTSGEAVRVVVGPKARLAGFAFFDPGSPIRARIVGSGGMPSAEWAAALIESAARLRDGAVSLETTNAMRLVHGEADGASGLVIDRYGPVATVRFDGGAADAFWRQYLPAIFPILEARGVRSLFIRGEGVILGDPLPAELVVDEDRARFEVDLEHGQKTGLFLDQRPNRRRVGELAKGRVLNLCSYTGGFSVHAALGGATSVTSVDTSAPATEAARRNFERSGLNPSDHQFIAADVFEFLAGQKANFDLIVCDPPSFAPRRSSVDKATRAYVRLNRLAFGALRRGGLLLTASCSSHITSEQFAEAVAEGALQARRQAQVIEVGGAGVDHPSRPGFPEGDYLKVLMIYSPA